MYNVTVSAILLAAACFIYSNCGQRKIAPAENRPQSVQVEAKTVSFWDRGATTLSDSGQDQPAELGLRFKSSVAAQLTGVRFFKLHGTNGQHRAKVWSSDGRLLDSIAFRHETPSGWQQVNFEPSIPLHANETYTVSYNAERGHYAFTKHFFDVAVSKAPLEAGIAAGVFAYGKSGVWPHQSFENTNYWIDPIVFTAPLPMSSRTVSLSWNPSTSPNVTYRIYRKSSANDSYRRPALASGLTSRTYVDHLQAARGDEFYYVVRAVDSKGRESSDSNEAHVIVPDRPPSTKSKTPAR